MTPENHYRSVHTRTLKRIYRPPRIDNSRGKMHDILIGFYGADKEKFVGPASRGNKTREMISRIKYAQPVADDIRERENPSRNSEERLVFETDALKSDDAHRFVQLTRSTYLLRSDSNTNIARCV